MAAIPITIIFVIWNIGAFQFYFFIPKAIKKIDTAIDEISKLEPEEHPFRRLLSIFELGSQFWKAAAQPFLTIYVVIVDLFLIISFLKTFH